MQSLPVEITITITNAIAGLGWVGPDATRSVSFEIALLSRWN